MTERHERDETVIVERDRDGTTGSGGVIALIVAVVAIVLIVWFVMVSGGNVDTEDNDNGDVSVTVPTTLP